MPPMKWLAVLFYERVFGGDKNYLNISADSHTLTLPVIRTSRFGIDRENL